MSVDMELSDLVGRIQRRLFHESPTKPDVYVAGNLNRILFEELKPLVATGGNRQDDPEAEVWGMNDVQPLSEREIEYVRAAWMTERPHEWAVKYGERLLTTLRVQQAVIEAARGVDIGLVRMCCRDVMVESETDEPLSNLEAALSVLPGESTKETRRDERLDDTRKNRVGTSDH